MRLFLEHLVYQTVTKTLVKIIHSGKTYAGDWDKHLVVIATHLHAFIAFFELQVFLLICDAYQGLGPAGRDEVFWEMQWFIAVARGRCRPQGVSYRPPRPAYLVRDKGPGHTWKGFTVRKTDRSKNKVSQRPTVTASVTDSVTANGHGLCPQI